MIQTGCCTSTTNIICFFNTILTAPCGGQCIGGTPPATILFTGRSSPLHFTRIVWVTSFPAALSLMLTIPRALVKTEKFHWWQSSPTTILKAKKLAVTHTRHKHLLIVWMRDSTGL